VSIERGDKGRQSTPAHTHTHTHTYGDRWAHAAVRHHLHTGYTNPHTHTPTYTHTLFSSSKVQTPADLVYMDTGHKACVV
jgi:hypothetical protein